MEHELRAMRADEFQSRAVLKLSTLKCQYLTVVKRYQKSKEDLQFLSDEIQTVDNPKALLDEQVAGKDEIIETIKAENVELRQLVAHLETLCEKHVGQKDLAARISKSKQDENRAKLAWALQVAEDEGLDVCKAGMDPFLVETLHAETGTHEHLGCFHISSA